MIKPSISTNCRGFCGFVNLPRCHAYFPECFWFQRSFPSLRYMTTALSQKPVINKLLVCVCCLLWFFIITKAFPIAYNVDPQFISEASFITRLGYAFISIQAARPKFYFAWTLGKQTGELDCYQIRRQWDGLKVCQRS